MQVLCKNVPGGQKITDFGLNIWCASLFVWYLGLNWRYVDLSALCFRASAYDFGLYGAVILACVLYIVLCGAIFKGCVQCFEALGAAAQIK